MSLPSGLKFRVRNGKLSFSPPVTDLANQGFPLIGGRLDYLDNQPVAALVFQRRKHIINLFIWPTSRNLDSPISSLSRQGYHLIHWKQGAMTFWAVSDVSMADMIDFSQLFQNQFSPPATP